MMGTFFFKLTNKKFFTLFNSNCCEEFPGLRKVMLKNEGVANLIGNQVFI